MLEEDTIAEHYASIHRHQNHKDSDDDPAIKEGVMANRGTLAMMIGWYQREGLLIKLPQQPRPREFYAKLSSL